jgi:xanthine dehydrogenase accessory factor
MKKKLETILSFFSLYSLLFMERYEIEDIMNANAQAQLDGVRVALATVVRVRGSAYRREGAKMLIREDGDYVCMLSGGCLEAEVVAVAIELIESGMSKVVSYDLSEDAMWGLGIGCGGSVDILIEPLENNPLLESWLGVLEREELAIAAVGLDVAGFQRVIVRSGGQLEGVTDPVIMQSIRDSGLEMMALLYPRAETKAIDTLRHSSDWFFDISSPAPELLIFGAGHDAIPLAKQAVALGWHVQIVDTRATFLNAERFPNCDLVLVHAEEFEAKLRVGNRTFAMLMNHHLERDTACLAWILSQDVPYVGVLGPKSRFENMRSSQMGNLAHVRNPVGLDIGAESPDEVALAIMSELIAVRRGFKGGLLNGRKGRIHDPI